MFRSRRSVASLPETAKVAEVVQAYYDAGKRPASHLAPPPAQTAVEAPFVAPEPEFVPQPVPEPVLTPQPAPAAAPERMAPAAPAEAAEQSAPVHKTLADLAEELEAFIEVIRYGDDLGSSTARN